MNFLSAAAFAQSVKLQVVQSGGGRYVSLYEIKAVLSPETSFDVILQRGKLYNKGHVAVYTVGQSVIIADGKLYKDNFPVTRYKGDILIPAYLAANIIKTFYPDKDTADKGSQIVISPKPKKSQDTNSIASGKSGNAEPISFIIIDPGHGGKDPGAVGKGNLREKNMTLGIAKKVEASLKKMPNLKGINIYLTRRTDKFLELYERTAFANSKLKKNVNGVFVSVHVNASLSPKISGYETYFLSQNPSNEDARNTAALENNVVVFEEGGGKKKYGDIEYIEARMITTQIQKESSMLANAIQRVMRSKLKKFESRGVRKADFFVLRGSLMPAALVEVGFITNPTEAKQLNRADYQTKIAEAIAGGIASFIAEYNKAFK